MTGSPRLSSALRFGPQQHPKGSTTLTAADGAPASDIHPVPLATSSPALQARKRGHTEQTEQPPSQRRRVTIAALVDAKEVSTSAPSRPSVTDLIFTNESPTSPSIRNATETTLSSQQARVSIGSLVNKTILDTKIGRSEFCQKMEINSLKEFAINFLKEKEKADTKKKSAKKIDNQVSCTVLILKQFNNLKKEVEPPLPGANFCYNEYIESVKEAQEKDSTWASKSESDKAKTIYIIVSKKLEAALPEDISIFQTASNSKKNILNRRHRKELGISIISKIIICHAMCLSTAAKDEIINEPHYFYRDSLVKKRQAVRQERINSLQDSQEKEFVSIVFKELSKVTNNKSSRQYLYMALSYQDLPVHQKFQSSLMRVIASEASSLLSKSVTERELPKTWQAIIAAVETSLTSSTKKVLEHILANDYLLKYTTQLNAT
jgi:hypothetical protein